MEKQPRIWFKSRLPKRYLAINENCYQILPINIVKDLQITLTEMPKPQIQVLFEYLFF